jgi:hypothetical protein
MKKFLIASVFVLFAIPANSQSGLYGSLDLPFEQGGVAYVPYGQLRPGGWALDCSTGAKPVPTVVVLQFLQIPPPGYSQFFIPQLFTVFHPSRPDVREVFQVQCPNITNTSTGFDILIYNQPPPGIYLMHVSFGVSPGIQITLSRYIQIY